MEANDPLRAAGVNSIEAVPKGGRRDGLLAAAVVVGAALLAWPFAGITVGDDFSYAKTALDFAQHGRLIYNGWASMVLGWQAVWGALFIRLFGFSFDILRVSMLLIAGATIYLMHQVLLRFGVHRRNAIFGALTLGLTPLFLPLAASFMTDLPGLFSVLLCLAMCQRAVAARTDRSTVGWLVAAFAANVGTGTVRQICWLGALVMVPSTALLLRRRRGVLVASGICWLASVACVLACIRWLYRQPWTIPERVLGGTVTVGGLAPLSVQLLKATLVIVWVTAPVNAAFLAIMARRHPRKAILVLGGVALLAAAMAVLWREGTHSRWIMPWLWPMLDAFGPVLEPKVFSWKTRVVLTVLIGTMTILLIWQGWSAWSRRREPLTDAGRVRLALLGPFSLSALIMMVPRALYLYFQDRYFLLLLPAVLVGMLLWYQRTAGKPLPRVSWWVLAIFAGYSIAVVHDEYASMRTEQRVAQQAEAAGVSRNEIALGFGPDEWYEVTRTGHVNNPSFASSARGFFKPPVRSWPLSTSCVRFDWYLVPSVQPRWFVAPAASACFVPGPFPTLSYRAWLPPFRRTRQLMAPAIGRTGEP